MGRYRFSEEDRDAVFCQLFIESLSEPALSWSFQLDDSSINDFWTLSAQFLKYYIMFTRQDTSFADLWKLSQSPTESLQDFMVKFKQIPSRVDIKDHLAAEALINSLWINSNFREYLQTHLMISLEDALHCSRNFIKMEDDKRAYRANQQALKQTTTRETDANQEPRQHAPYNKHDQKKGIIYAVTKDEQQGMTAAAREPGWNVWE